MGRLFGTDGARGVANAELTCETAMAIGRAAAMVLAEAEHHKPKIVIGKDTRISSDMLEAALVAGLVTAFEASSILDVVFHGLLLWYLAMGVRRGREAMEEPEGQRETPEPLPQNTEFYDASMGERPNSPSLGQPAEGKHRTLLTAAYGSHEIEVRRSYGLTELIVDGRVYGRQEGVVETGYTIRARVSGHDVETEFTPTGKQLLRVDGQVIARKQRLF